MGLKAAVAVLLAVLILGIGGVGAYFVYTSNKSTPTGKGKALESDSDEEEESDGEEETDEEEESDGEEETDEEEELDEEEESDEEEELDEEEETDEANNNDTVDDDDEMQWFNFPMYRGPRDHGEVENVEQDSGFGDGLEGCKQACEDTEGCGGLIYDQSGNSNACYLKHFPGDMKGKIRDDYDKGNSQMLWPIVGLGPQPLMEFWFRDKANP
jgi:hypothetical protein